MRGWLAEKLPPGMLPSVQNPDQPTRQRVLTRGHKIALYLHAQNEDNLTHILKGGIGFRGTRHPDQIYQVSEQELAALLSTMTEEDKQFATAVAALYARQGKDMAEIFLDKNGYELPLMENYYPADVMSVSRYGGSRVRSRGLASRRACS